MKYEIKTKLVGVSFKNEDGSDRQLLIHNLKPEDILTIEAEPTNIYDKNSHIIKNPAGQILGHLKKELALDVVARYSQGHVLLLVIKSFEVTGDILKKQNLGVNITFEMEKAD